jgi:hypothetical protein
MFGAPLAAQPYKFLFAPACAILQTPPFLAWLAHPSRPHYFAVGQCAATCLVHLLTFLQRLPNGYTSTTLQILMTSHLCIVTFYHSRIATSYHDPTPSLQAPPNPSVGYVGTIRAQKKNHNQRSWDNLCARKELIHCWLRLFFMLDAFLSHGNIVGVVIFTWGRIWGNNICRVGVNFEITVLEVPKLQKTIPRNGELPATLCRSVV